MKGLGGIELETAKLYLAERRSGVREFPVYDPDGDLLNGKRTASVHEFSTDHHPADCRLDLSTLTGQAAQSLLRDEEERVVGATAPTFDAGTVRIKGVTA